nr:uncharacterized protein LOC117275883 [Nicotiana tomentosiformis]
MTCNETLGQDGPDYEEYNESMMPENLPQEIEQLESQKKHNLEEIEVINLGSEEDVKETRYRLATDPARPPVKQKPRKFKLDLSLRIKEVATKQIEANVVRVTNYPTWLGNIVPVPKKDGKIRICVDYRDLNKASPKNDFPLPNIISLSTTAQSISYSHSWIVLPGTTRS